MNSFTDFWEKPVCSKKFVNVSVCKCNIKAKPGTYYARVCKTGRVGSEELLAQLKQAAPYLDINMMRAGMEKMVELIAELAASGKDVDLFGLGTFSLATQGAIEVNPAQQSYVRDEETECKNADYDVSSVVVKRPKFSLKFAPSAEAKKLCENVEMHLAIKKRRAPLIESIANAIPENANSPVSILKITGENLKIAGESKRTGLYIKEENGEEFKIEQANIIQNTPKMVLILLTKRLRNEAKYTLSLRTQYAKMGTTCTTRMLREGALQFVWKGTSCGEGDSQGAVQRENMLQALDYKNMHHCEKEQETCENKECSNTSSLCKMSENSTKELLPSSLKESESKENASKATGHKKRGNKGTKAKQLKLKSTALIA